MTRKNIILLAVLIALVTSAWYFQSYKLAEQSKSQANNFLSDINTSEISKVKITTNKWEVVLEKIDKEWFVSKDKDIKADQEAIDHLLTSLLGISSSTLTVVSANQDGKESLGLNDANAFKIEIDQKDKSFKFLVGKGDASLSYISRQDDQNSYQVLSDISTAVANKNWVDLYIFKTSNLITNLELKSSKDSLSLYTKDKEWYDQKTKQKLNNNKIIAMTSKMSEFKAESFAEVDLKQSGLDKPKFQITAIGEGFISTLQVGNDINDKSYVKRSDNSKIYLVKKSDLSVFKFNIKELK